MKDCSWIPSQFENILPEHLGGCVSCSSHRTDKCRCHGYNCIAWAAGKKDKWWWPIDDPCSYWPEGLPREQIDQETMSNFVRAFQALGYVPCLDGSFEEGFEKVAFFQDGQGRPTHAARSLPNGRWTSKLGRFEDIEHDTLEAVEGKWYGTATTFLRRPFLNKARS